MTEWIWGKSDKFSLQMSRVGTSDDYICIGKAGGTGNSLLLYDTEQLTFIKSVSVLPSSASTNSITVDGNYAYVSRSNNYIYKINLPALTEAASKPGTTSSYSPMIVHGNKLYVSDQKKIYAYNLSNLSLAASSDDVSTEVQVWIQSLAIHGDYIYAGVGGWIDGTGYIYELHRCSLASLEWVDSISLFAQAYPSNINIHGDYIYISQGSKIYRYNLSDLTYVGESDEYADTIQKFTIYGDYLYAGGASGAKNPIYCYNLSDLTYVDESPDLTDYAAAYGVIGLNVHHGYVYIVTDYYILRWPLYKTPPQSYTAPTVRNVVKKYKCKVPTLRQLSLFDPSLFPPSTWHVGGATRSSPTTLLTLSEALPAEFGIGLSCKMLHKSATKSRTFWQTGGYRCYFDSADNKIKMTNSITTAETATASWAVDDYVGIYAGLKNGKLFIQAKIAGIIGNKAEVTGDAIDSGTDLYVGSNADNEGHPNAIFADFTLHDSGDIDAEGYLSNVPGGGST